MRPWVPLQLSMDETPFATDPERVYFFIKLLLRKGYQAEFVFWEGRDDHPLRINSFKTSIRTLARELRLPRTTVWELLNYFEREEFVEVTRSQRSGIIIRIRESDAYRTLARPDSGHLYDSPSARKEREDLERRKKARTLAGHKAGHSSGHSKNSLTPLSEMRFHPVTSRAPDTFADTKPDGISLRLKYNLNPPKSDASQQDFSPMPAEFRERFLRRGVDKEKDAPGGGEISVPEETFRAEDVHGFAGMPEEDNANDVGSAAT